MSTKTEGQMLPTAGPPLQEAEQPHSHYGRSRCWSHDDQMLAPSWLEGMELGCGSHRQTCPWAPCAKARATALGRGGDGSVPALDTSSPWTPRSVSPSSISPGGLAGLSPMPWCHWAAATDWAACRAGTSCPSQATTALEPLCGPWYTSWD